MGKIRVKGVGIGIGRTLRRETRTGTKQIKKIEKKIKKSRNPITRIPRNLLIPKDLPHPRHPRRPNG